MLGFNFDVKNKKVIVIFRSNFPLFAISFYAELVSASPPPYDHYLKILKRVQHKKDAATIGARISRKHQQSIPILMFQIIIHYQLSIITRGAAEQC